jgi:predicted MFS family arabinose efflux permease
VTAPSSRRTAVLLAAAALAFFSGFYVLFLPIPGGPAPAHAPGRLGVALGAFGLASLLGRSVAGRLADRLGARPVLASGGALLAASAALASAPAPQLALASRVLLGLAYVAFSTGLGVLVARAVPPGGRVVALGWSGVPANVAVGLAPALIRMVAAWPAPLPPFMLAVVLGLASSAVAVFLPSAGSDEVARRGPFLAALPLGLLGPLALAGASGVVFAAFAQFSPHALGKEAGAAFAAYASGMVVARLAGVPLARRLSFGLPFAFVIAAAGLAALVTLPSRAAALVGPLLVAGGLAFQHPAVLALHVARRPLSRSGCATAGFYVGFDVGIGLGGAALGFALDGFGPGAVFALAAAAALAGAFLALRVDPAARARLAAR